MSKLTGYIALGSNLNNPHEQVLQAINCIEQLPCLKVVKRASLYQSKPLGPKDQPDFVNTVIEVETSCLPTQLIIQLQDIELKMGRVKTRHWGERVIDLDLIAVDDIVINSTLLTLPHPEARHRDFVIIPLCEISPYFVIVGQGQAKLLAKGFKSSLQRIK